AGDEDDGRALAAACQFALELESAPAFEAHVEHEAGGGIGLFGGEKILRRREGPDRVTDRGQQALQRDTNSGVIVDDIDDGIVAHGCTPTLLLSSTTVDAGREKRKTAPVGALAAIQSRPPWASITDRQNMRPMPMPSGFVETKGRKMRSAMSGLTPGPVSATAASTSPGSPSSMLMVSRRTRPPPAFVASTALSIRFETTCSSWIGLQITILTSGG